MPLRLVPRLLPLVLAAAMLPVQAQALKDAQWRQWFDHGRVSELERAAKARHAQQPGDADAVVALALTAAEFGDGKRLQSALEAAQQCTERQPQQAHCYYALGTALGTQALQAGALGGMRLASKVKDAFAKAVELDPLLYEARQALTQFYLAVPGIAGGSVDKARELAAAAQTRQPEHAKVLRALVALREERLADAERELAGVKPGDDISLRSDLRQVWAQIGYGHFRAKRFGQAKAVFEGLVREHPSQAIGVYGLARIATDQGQHDEAIRLFERARTLEGAQRLPIDHRLGQALIAKGDKAKAREVLERFIASDTERRVNPRNLEDAKKLLSELS